MKKSRYNFIRNIGKQAILYNAATDATSILDPDVARLFEEKTVEQILAIHPDFYEHLRSNSFIVADDKDELKSQLQIWEAEDNDLRSFSLSVNPTLNCNMDCWYCYEKHDGDLNMKDEVVDKVKKLIASKMSSPHLEAFHLVFFGGEPLLNFNRIPKDLIGFATRKASEAGKSLSMSFVTNGYLLSHEILDYLHKSGLPVTFQITLDGNEDLHDCVRHTKSGDKSYKRILQNASGILRHPNMNLVLRCNFTVESLPSFLDVATDLSEWKETLGLDLNRLTVDFHQVWQDYSKDNTQNTETLEREVREAFISYQLPVSIVKKANRYRCYADRNNSVLVNFNGDLFRCTARDFNRENREGILTDNGELAWNERSVKRNAVKWNNPSCNLCNIYPLCAGACSQNRLESGRLSGCDYGYSEEEKADIVTSRINWLLAKASKN